MGIAKAIELPSYPVEIQARIEAEVRAALPDDPEILKFLIAQLTIQTAFPFLQVKEAQSRAGRAKKERKAILLAVKQIMLKRPGFGTRAIIEVVPESYEPDEIHVSVDGIEYQVYRDKLTLVQRNVQTGHDQRMRFRALEPHIARFRREIREEMEKNKST